MSKTKVAPLHLHVIASIPRIRHERPGLEVMGNPTPDMDRSKWYPREEVKAALEWFLRYVDSDDGFERLQKEQRMIYEEWRAYCDRYEDCVDYPRWLAKKAFRDAAGK